MEPSDQCAYSNDINSPEDLPSKEKVIPETLASPESMETSATPESMETSATPESMEILAPRPEELEDNSLVHGFLEVEEYEDGTRGIELNGQHFVFQPVGVEGEFYVLVREEQVVTLDDAMKQDEAIEEDPLPTEEIFHNIEGHASEKMEQGTVVHENSDNNHVENVKYLTIREVSNRVAHVPTPTDTFSSTVALNEGNENMLNLGAVAEEIESAGSFSATAEHIQDLESQSPTDNNHVEKFKSCG